MTKLKQLIRAVKDCVNPPPGKCNNCGKRDKHNTCSQYVVESLDYGRVLDCESPFPGVWCEDCPFIWCKECKTQLAEELLGRNIRRTQ